MNVEKRLECVYRPMPKNSVVASVISFFFHLYTSTLQGVCDLQHRPVSLHSLLCAPAARPECTICTGGWHASVSWQSCVWGTHVSQAASLHTRHQLYNAACTVVRACSAEQWQITTGDTCWKEWSHPQWFTWQGRVNGPGGLCLFVSLYLSVQNSILSVFYLFWTFLSAMYSF